MPIYEYKCKTCGYKFEIIQKMSDDPVKKCPKCEKEVEKVFSKSSTLGSSKGVVESGSPSHSCSGFS